MTRAVVMLLGLMLLALAGCDCPMCKKAAETKPMNQSEPLADTPAPAPRIVGLDEGWELAAEGATYTASQTPADVIIKAAGEHPTGGYETKLVMSPLRIYPPQWMLAVKKPSGATAQVISPFEATATFKAKDVIQSVQVRDAGGKHTIAVEQARD